MEEKIMSFCENCGATMSEDAKFCLSCGTAAGAAAQQPAAPQAQGYAAAAQPAYTPPAYTPPSYAQLQSTEPLSVGGYIAMFFLLCIPVANFVLLFVWSFGGSVNQNKKNYARATLLLMVIAIVLSIVFGGVLTGLLSSMIRGY